MFPFPELVLKKMVSPDSRMLPLTGTPEVVVVVVVVMMGARVVVDDLVMDELTVVVLVVVVAVLVVVVVKVVVVTLIGIVVLEWFSLGTNNITSSIATSPCQVVPLLPMNEIVTDCPTNSSNEIISESQESPRGPDLDHNTCVLPVLLSRASTLREPMDDDPCM
jgi:hypothetical protein